MAGNLKVWLSPCETRNLIWQRGRVACNGQRRRPFRHRWRVGVVAAECGGSSASLDRAKGERHGRPIQYVLDHKYKILLQHSIEQGPRWCLESLRTKTLQI